MIKIAVIVPVLSNFKGAIKALASLKTQHTWTPFIQPQWKHNYPISQVWNKAIINARDLGYDFCLVINDDVLFAPQTVDMLVETLGFQVNEKVVMVTASNVRDFVLHPRDIYTYESPPRALTESPDFSCFLVRPNILEIVGGFDESFNPAYFEDNDYHYRIRLLGYSALKVHHAPYYHFGSVTYRAEAKLRNHATVRNFEKSRQYYVQKWGGLPGHERYKTPFNGELE